MTQASDPDGLPLPDAEFLAELETDALTARPKATDWAVLVAGLRWAVETERREIEAENAPPGTTASRIALKVIIHFLEKQHCVMHHRASRPLIELQAALTDLAAGQVSTMFKPVLKPGHNPGKGHTHALRQGLAARAMSLLMDGGQTEDAASRRVAHKLGTKQGTVKNWRDRLNQTPGPGASQDAVRHYREPLPDWPGSTPIQQAERLLEMMRSWQPSRQKSQ